MGDRSRIHRFYVEQRLIPGDERWLGDHTAHQISRVLRLRPGDTVTLFNGSGLEIDARIDAVERTRVAVILSSEIRRGVAPPAPEIHLGVALLKSDRFDVAIQKSVELGVTSITALECDRSVVTLTADRTPARLDRWRRIAREALEQCGRADDANVYGAETFASFAKQAREGDRIIASEIEHTTTLADGLSVDSRPVTVLIGPEGGFTDEELRIATDAGFTSVSLGPTILRSETAAISAVAMIRAIASVRTSNAQRLE
jgi:16S rRNA (uracil1498-N3)-methyltransferase